MLWLKKSRDKRHQKCLEIIISSNRFWNSPFYVSFDISYLPVFILFTNDPFAVSGAKVYLPSILFHPLCLLL